MAPAPTGLVDPSIVASMFSDKEKARGTIRLKKPKPKVINPGSLKETELVAAELKASQPAAPLSPLINPLSPSAASAFPTGRPLEDEPEKLQCKHCKRTVLKSTAPKHIKDCLRKKAEKIQKKKEAKEARDAAKKGGGADKDNNTNGDDLTNGTPNGKAPAGDEGRGEGKSTAKASTENGAAVKKGKKRKAEDDGGEKVTKKQKKKDEQKTKAPKPKGPVDVEKQCGVPLPNGNMCARSLTCKSHSMGAKRGVPGRSMPYDTLLAMYQKKNQAKQQRAALDANNPAPSDTESDTGPGAGQPLDWDEETDLIMSAIARARPQPLLTRLLISIKSKYQYVRMKEVLHNALDGSRGGSLFATRPQGPVTEGVEQGAAAAGGGAGGGGGGGTGRAGNLAGADVNGFMSSAKMTGEEERRVSGAQRFGGAAGHGQGQGFMGPIMGHAQGQGMQGRRMSVGVVAVVQAV